MQIETQLKDAAFIQAYKILKAEGFYDKLAGALNLKPKTSNKAKAAITGENSPKKPLPKTNGKKKAARAAACRVSPASK